MNSVKRKLARIRTSIEALQDYMCTTPELEGSHLYETVDVCVNDARLSLEDALDAIEREEDRVSRELKRILKESL